MTNSNKLLDGSILKSLVYLAIPIIFANLLQTAYQLTDTFWVGRLGSDAVAAVSISFPIIFLIVSLGFGLAMAGTILVAQYKGKGDRKSIDHVTTQTMLMVVMVSIVLAIIGYFLSPMLTRLMGTDVAIFDMTSKYMQISFLAMIFSFIFMGFQTLMRGVGNVKTPMYIVLGTVLLNLLLDPLFIFGFGPIKGQGVVGAALATIGTQSLAAILGIILLARGKQGLELKLKELKPDFKLIKKLFKIGMPASIEHSTRAIGMAIMIFVVVSFGTLTTAAYGIGSRMLSFVILPALGLSMATSTLIGQNMGAGKIKRAEQISALSSKISFISLTILGILMFIFARPLTSAFIPGEIETINSSVQFLRLMALTFGFIGLQMSYNGVFRGSGDTKSPMVLSIVSLCLLQFPLAYFLSNHTSLGQTGLWLSFPITNILAATITYFWFKKSNWSKKDVTRHLYFGKKSTAKDD